MPLYINGQSIDKVPTSVTEFISGFPHFIESSQALCSMPCQTVDPASLLYVGQRELAAVPRADSSVKILGSEDATTCHMLVLRHSGSGATCMAHLDGCRTSQSIERMVELTMRLSGEDSHNDRLELHIVGGFKDDRGLSEQLSLEVMSAVNEIKEAVHLQMACVTDLNDVVKNGHNFPVIYGIAMDIETGALYPATFPDKGPDMALRAAKHFTGSDEILEIYNSEESIVTIGPFHYDTMNHIHKWCEVPDYFIRKHLSTSPTQEPTHFESQVRAALIQIRDFPNPLQSVFVDGKPRRYKRGPGGGWANVT